MDLGSFSTSLAVKDLAASKSFYEKLGFEVFGGDAQQNWLILKNGEHDLGLFQGMFEGNLLTGTDKLTFQTQKTLAAFIFLNHCALPRRKGTLSK